jgi:hypothetical protein
MKSGRMAEKHFTDLILARLKESGSGEWEATDTWRKLHKEDLCNLYPTKYNGLFG